MKRLRTLALRALVAALLLVAVTGGPASADPGSAAVGRGGPTTQALPDDPGYGP